MSNKYIYLLIFLLISVGIYSQDKNTIDIKLETAGTLTDGDFAPFWITNNNFGIGSEKTKNVYLRSSILYGNKLFDNKLALSIEADMIVSHNLQSDFYFHQLYADLKYRSLGLTIGAKENNSLFKNKQLSSGGLALSKNYRPIPQIEIGIPEFTNVPFTKGYLQVMGGLSFGKFLDDDYKKHHAKDGLYALNVLYHKKYAFLKFQNKPSWNVILGAEFNTQWGGELYREGEMWAKAPKDFKNFMKILVPGGGDSKATESDQANTLGNVNGSWHFIFNYNAADYSLKAYHEHIFEDKSGMMFQNIPDGLYGIEVNLKKRQLISSVLFEFLYTRDQSGPGTYPDGRTRFRGNDNYYNHGEYGSMTYYGYVLGNPLLISPLYNKGESIRIWNNKITAYHLGISGFIANQFQHRLLFTYSRSYGSPLKIQPTYKQFSALAEVTYSPSKLIGWNFTGALAFDNAKEMIGDNLGFRLKAVKNFSIR